MEYNYNNPLSITSQFSFCGLPFRLDTYAGCAIGCRYCFARIRGGNIESKKIKIANPQLIINRFKNALVGDNQGVISEFIKNRVPLHFGGMSDPFQSLEKQYKVSFTVLEYLKSIDYPVVISTKSDLIIEKEYLDLLKNYKSLVIQISFSTLNENNVKIIEPNAPNPNKLIDVIKELTSNKINVSIRWQPFIIGVSEEIEIFVEKVKDTGIKHLGFEHLKLPIERNSDLDSKIKLITGKSIYEQYKNNNAIIDGREYILPIDIKLHNIKKLKEATKGINLSLGFADNEFQYLSDYDCCCSGVDMFEGFENWYKPQISHAIKKAYKNNHKIITLNNIEKEWNSNGAIDKYINSKTRLLKSNHQNTMFDYIKHRWNDLNSNFNPTKYYNIKFNNELDDNENKIYNFTEDNIF